MIIFENRNMSKKAVKFKLSVFEILCLPIETVLIIRLTIGSHKCSLILPKMNKVARIY